MVFHSQTSRLISEATNNDSEQQVVLIASYTAVGACLVDLE